MIIDVNYAPRLSRFKHVIIFLAMQSHPFPVYFLSTWEQNIHGGEGATMHIIVWVVGLCAWDYLILYVIGQYPCQTECRISLQLFRDFGFFESCESFIANGIRVVIRKALLYLPLPGTKVSGFFTIHVNAWCSKFHADFCLFLPCFLSQNDGFLYNFEQTFTYLSFLMPQNKFI